jgi:hypothetical protein
LDNFSHEVQLTSSETANLWTQYTNDSLSICILTHSIEKAQDQDIKKVLEFALKIAQSHLGKVRQFLQQDNIPVPIGFSVDEDVNLDAPPLFTDTFILIYMHVMTLIGLTGYAGAVGSSTRPDQIKYFIQCSNETMELYQRIVNVMLYKGVYSKPPRINKAKKADFVDNQFYLTGWFGKKRPLNAIEITSINFNMLKVVIKTVLQIGFAQVCQNKEIQKYFLKGKKKCEEEFGTLSKILTEDELSSPNSWVSEVTDSKVSPFSERLLLNHIVILVSAAVGYFGAGLSVSQRRDLGSIYSTYIADMALYAEDGAQLLIKYGWLEQPPLATDRNKLAKENH